MSFELRQALNSPRISLAEYVVSTLVARVSSAGHRPYHHTTSDLPHCFPIGEFAVGGPGSCTGGRGESGTATPDGIDHAGQQGALSLGKGDDEQLPLGAIYRPHAMLRSQIVVFPEDALTQQPATRDLTMHAQSLKFRVIAQGSRSLEQSSPSADFARSLAVSKATNVYK